MKEVARQLIAFGRLKPEVSDYKLVSRIGVARQLIAFGRLKRDVDVVFATSTGRVARQLIAFGRLKPSLMSGIRKNFGSSQDN